MSAIGGTVVCPFGVRLGTVLGQFWLVLGPSGSVLDQSGSDSGSFGTVFVVFCSFWVPSGGHIEELNRAPPNLTPCISNQCLGMKEADL